VIRKWSYIKYHKISHINNNETKNYNFYQKFNFKIFRQNTRFKNFNQGHTKFIRKTNALKNRRVGLKTYFISSSSWIKYILKYKKLINFCQSTLTHNFTLNYSYLNMLTTQSSHLSLIGNGVNSINFSFCKKNILSGIKKSLVYYNNSKVLINSKLVTKFRYNTTNHMRKLQPTAQFNKLSVVDKLNTTGLLFININFLSYNIPISKSSFTKSMNLMLHINEILKIILKQLVFIRQLHTYKLLNNIKYIYINNC
jgi:hypothetical protein